ncbi:MAG: pseudouridine synthase [Alphaproteobacteria bacterium]|nr:pseudouridine synthase [Alphaproteobacteria bacterium]
MAKVIARAGLCSRRDAELWIASGRVAVNGKTLDNPAFNVTDEDRIMVDDAPLGQRERTRLFVFHKPKGFVTTARDPEGRPTIYDALPEGLPRLVTVGRLDINTEGLLLLTNDGGLARVLELPETGWLRRYRVRAHGHADPAALERLAEGVSIEGVEYRGIEARIERQQGDNVWIAMGLREGKNREIKRVLEHLGLSVNRLIRVSFGPFQLGEIEEGEVEEIPTRVLKDQLGEKLAQQANADFDAPVAERKPVREAEETRGRKAPARSAPARSGGFRKDDGPGRRAPEGRGAYTKRPAEFEEPRATERPKDFRRKHVATVREEAAGDKRRMRSEHSQAQDRRGRGFAIERRVEAGRDAKPSETPSRGFKERAPRKPRDFKPRDFKPREERGVRGSRDPAKGGREDRPQRRHGKMEGDFRPRQKPPFAHGERKPPRQRDAADGAKGGARGGAKNDARSEARVGARKKPARQRPRVNTLEIDE